jgi:hypothetical protein
VNAPAPTCTYATNFVVFERACDWRDFALSKACHLQGRSLATCPETERIVMASTKQRQSASKNIKKAAAAAKRKGTLKKLPKKTKTALAKQANKVKRERAKAK